MIVSSINNSPKTILLSTILAFFPISYIAGSLIINLNILVFVLMSILICGREIFNFRITNLDKLFILLFLYICFVGLFNTLENVYSEKSLEIDFTVLKKSFLYLRYFLFYFAIRILFEKKLIDLKLLIGVALVASLFVSLDLIYQFINGKDIFGYEKMGRKYPGPFGDEAIAGGYLQRFSILGIFYFLLFNNLNNKLQIFSVIFSLIIFLFSIIISGNRMPLILFMLAIILLLVFDSNLRKYIILILLISTFTIILTIKTNPIIKMNFSNFVQQITWSYEYLKVPKEIRDEKYKLYPHYLYEFSTSYETWKMNKFIGGGIKSFRVNCTNRDKVIEKWRDWSCNIHPHNYYLEILTELGVFGFILIFIILIKILYVSLIKNNYLATKIKFNKLITPFMLVFVSEMFLIRSSGSFFTTNNSAFIFLLLAIIVSLSKNKDLN
tara:strand:- start:871 stop:2187 length:1317 start_codon:yes stop_codon:yes gene_type:complete